MISGHPQSVNLFSEILQKKTCQINIFFQLKNDLEPHPTPHTIGLPVVMKGLTRLNAR